METVYISRDEAIEMLAEAEISCMQGDINGMSDFVYLVLTVGYKYTGYRTETDKELNRMLDEEINSYDDAVRYRISCYPKQRKTKGCR